MKISINIPSYKRPYVETLEYIHDAIVWVSESQLQDYKAKNASGTFRTMPDEVNGNIARVRNYILDHTKEDDAVVIMDDDCKGLYYWEKNEKHLVEESRFLAFVEKYTNIAEQFGSMRWGVNVNQDKQVYREYSPFSLSNFVGAPFGVFLKGNTLRYDERIPLKEDYDMTLQQLNKYRKVLRLNKFFYIVKQHAQVGGVANMRSLKVEKEQLEFLQKKWGKDIVKFDNNSRSHNSTKQKTNIDLNPVIKAPIKGV